MKQDEFRQRVSVYGDSGNGKSVKIVEFDSEAMYTDGTADWVFACRESTDMPVRIEGTLRHENKEYIEAIANGTGGEIHYGSVWSDGNGL